MKNINTYLIGLLVLLFCNSVNVSAQSNEDCNDLDIVGGKWYGFFDDYHPGIHKRYPVMMQVESKNGCDVTVVFNFPKLATSDRTYEGFVEAGTVYLPVVPSTKNGFVIDMNTPNNISGSFTCGGLDYITFNLKRWGMFTEKERKNILNTSVEPIEEITYFDANMWETDKENAVFYRKATLDKNGEIDGRYREYYISGELRKKGFMDHGEAYGPVVWYFKSGKKMAKGEDICGEVFMDKSWDIDGNVILNDGEGKHLFYNHKEIVTREEQYSERRQTGPYKVYHHDGSLAVVGEIVDSEGLIKEQYSQKGESFKGGNGTYIFYHPNGVKMVEGEIKDGKSEGEWKWWDRNGELKQTVIFEQNARISSEEFGVAERKDIKNNWLNGCTDKDDVEFNRYEIPTAPPPPGFR